MPTDSAESIEKLRGEIRLEDYRAWLRELEKQDRWYAETVWIVVAALGTGLLPLRKLPDPAERIFAAWGVWAIGAAFVHMSATFLKFRITSYRNASRAVAATRKAFATRDFLTVDELAGAPLLSNNPLLFRRSTQGGGAFRFLFVAHQVALFLISAGACWVVRDFPHVFPPNVPTLLLMAAGVHFTWLSFQFHWRVSEADNLGEFIVTRARDAGIKVHHDAEVRLRRWFANGRSRLRERYGPAVAVLVEYEDRRYFSWFHIGVDVRSIVAVVLRVRRGGASTIPMQLARQLLRATPRTLKRKLFEVILGVYLVRRYGKSYILDVWLANAPFGTSRVIGIERAVTCYFRKPPTTVDALDGLLLAERATVCTGRYYSSRMARLVTWASARNLISEPQRVEAGVRIARMMTLMPGPIHPDLPSR